MSSSLVKKSKLDLIVRVRYSNPLPPPPCPPKMIDIPTTPARYAEPERLEAIANMQPFPMIVDAEMGLPLDLGRWDCLWEDNGDDSGLNPDPNNLPKLDPKDQALLGDLPLTASQSVGTPLTSLPSTPSASVFIPWLRKTEYISREVRSTPQASHEKHIPEARIDVSRSAQLRDIEASFAAAAEETFDLASLRHPEKANVTAVESYELLPDADVWANAYDLFRFQERPGERPLDTEDPRLDSAVLRPMQSHGDHFLAYYLTKDDEAAATFKRKRTDGRPAEQDEETTPFYFVRDFEVTKVEQDVTNEFLLVFDDGQDQDEDLYGASTSEPRRKTALYKNIERKMQLKKKRAQPGEGYLDKWGVVNLSHAPMVPEEVDERTEAAAEVCDPLYLLGGTQDAEGEPDQDAEGDMDPSSQVRRKLAATGFDDTVDVVGGE